MADPYDPAQRELLRRQEANWRSLPIILGAVFLSDITNPPGRSGSVETSDGQPR